MATVSKRHKLQVEIEFDDSIGSRLAQAKLIHWLETFGHTAPSFGFEFLQVERLAPTWLKHRIKGAAK